MTLVEVIARALGDPAPYIGSSSSSSLFGVVGAATSNDVTAEPVRHQRSASDRAGPPTPPPYSFHFAHAVYNVSIPENSIIKTYAVQPPNEPRMGLHVTSDLEVRYKIVAGDKDRFFKAEERAVGDFVFLAIRLRTNNIVLNREKGDSYRLEVKATGTRREGKSRTTLEADTVIDVRVLDANDLSPLFYPTDYSVAITEDTPLHKSILHVVAEDADLGLNGEIYYSILDETEQFAVHPTTGVITLTRPLRFAERALHELTVVANDRGIGSTSRNQASKARVKIKVLQPY
uniref:Cadherin domain-containing protein n=1 Tax=Anopheles epiroticus TaxID=199890 RepID=A0A182PCG9_9DIPT